MARRPAANVKKKLEVYNRFPLLAELRVSSYEPGQPGWLGVPISRLSTLFFVKISMCSYEGLGNRDEIVPI